jgi:hypothetical protein
MVPKVLPVQQPTATLLGERTNARRVFPLVLMFTRRTQIRDLLSANPSALYVKSSTE